MTQPIFEPTTQRVEAKLGFSTDQLFRRPAPPRPPVVLFIKVFSDTQTVTTGDKKFQFEISEDMDGMSLTLIEMYVTTVSSSGKPTLQVAKLPTNGTGAAVDVLSTKIEIDASEFNSRTAATQPVINTANDGVLAGDHYRLDVDVAGTGAKGLGVMLTFEFVV